MCNVEKFAGCLKRQNKVDDRKHLLSFKYHMVNKYLIISFLHKKLKDATPPATYTQKIVPDFRALLVNQVPCGL